jgi:hypothetical protein
MESDDQGKKERLVRLAGIAGMLAFGVDTAGTTILGLLKPGYDPIRSTISELGERGGVNSLAASIAFIVIGLAEAAFAIGLYRRSRLSRLALGGSILMLVNGLADYVGSGFFPCDAGGKYESASGQVHFAASVIGMAVMVFPAFCYWRVFAKAGRTRDAAVTACAAFAVLVGAIAFNVAFFTDSWLGVAQRFMDFAYFTWVFALSVNMIRKR